MLRVYSTRQLKPTQTFLALIFYFEEIFYLNFQVRILKHVNIDGKNFINIYVCHI